ncbi:hypothetical protein AXF42_Ash002767 [Apostasia shenzhenica]|uniref:Uncharacterized protein n=1 Tax=Apostasia shenzhenica TaxID=1088818 RepID=A0A2I0A781_9ASPA|nr:hypothetical protein AXF42_Ash002767 [Apostasia shenzhenica]
MAFAGHLPLILLLLLVSAGTAFGLIGIPDAYYRERYQRMGEIALLLHNRDGYFGIPWLVFCRTMKASRTPMWALQTYYYLVVMATESDKITPKSYMIVVELTLRGYVFRSIEEYPTYVSEHKVICLKPRK